MSCFTRLVVRVRRDDAGAVPARESAISVPFKVAEHSDCTEGARGSAAGWSAKGGDMAAAGEGKGNAVL